MMFETKDENSFDYRMHDGSPMKVSHHFRGETQMPVAIQTWVIPPGGYEGYHRHEGEGALVEFYQVLHGTARVRLGDEYRELAVGDSVLAAVGVGHDLVNIGTGELRVLVVWGPPGHFDMSGYKSHRMARNSRPQVRGPAPKAAIIYEKP